MKLETITLILHTSFPGVYLQHRGDRERRVSECINRKWAVSFTSGHTNMTDANEKQVQIPSRHIQRGVQCRHTCKRNAYGTWHAFRFCAFSGACWWRGCSGRRMKICVRHLTNRSKRRRTRKVQDGCYLLLRLSFLSFLSFLNWLSSVQDADLRNICFNLMWNEGTQTRLRPSIRMNNNECHAVDQLLWSPLFSLCCKNSEHFLLTASQMWVLAACLYFKPFEIRATTITFLINWSIDSWQNNLTTRSM